MLTELHRKICAMLAEAGYPAWAEDAVPPDAPLPFVTLSIRPASSLHGVGRVTLTGWLHGPGRHADRLAMANTLLKLVPGGGLKLPLDGGLALLQRGDRMNVEWPENPGVLGVRVSHELRLMGGDSDA